MSLWKKEYRSRSVSSQPPTTRVTACRTCGTDSAEGKCGARSRRTAQGRDRAEPGSQVLTRLAGQSQARSMLWPDSAHESEPPAQAQCNTCWLPAGTLGEASGPPSCCWLPVKVMGTPLPTLTATAKKGA